MIQQRVVTEQYRDKNFSPLVPVFPAGQAPPCPPACHGVLVDPTCPLYLAVLGCPRVLYFPSLLVGLTTINSTKQMTSTEKREEKWESVEYYQE